ncbi:MAG: phenylalanine--tRNA ligase subunit beta [Gammaproteobacteria bacterium]|nr:phenylalanine--tRNA ligase subunit beta [Gammaproteobacteria bacterium]
MKISEQWLREWVPVRMSGDALAERLTMAGLAVDARIPVSPPLDQVVVGEITALAPHPAADRLRVCAVRVGRDHMLEIVCGADNAAVGLKVPVALPGAELPGGVRIVRSEIRGVGSQGMLCSAKELGLAEAAEGLMVLDSGARPGMAVCNALGLDDHQIELDLTPNRGDCLSVAGLARELSTLTGVTARAPAVRAAKVRSRRQFRVTVRSGRDCPRYAGRVIEDIDPAAVTPSWLRERLRRSGVRSIHPVVDVTNYVMLELGQPLHAFDLDRLSGGLTVRLAQPGEVLALLDGNRVTVPEGALLIADSKGPCALAGIMGGLDSAVTAATGSVFLESAYFRPGAIASRARQMGLHTDSSHRFERGVDPQLQRRALERATQLILSLAGGRPGPVVEKVAARQLPVRTAVKLRAERVARLLGAPVPRQQIALILKRLGMRSVRVADGWMVTPPSWRFDISEECDLIEEVARIAGYEKLAPRRPQAPLQAGTATETRVSADRFRAMLVDRDYQEAITYSFVDPALQALVDPDHKPIVLANPIASDMAAMRTSLWPGLLGAAAHNLNRQQERVRLFEVGRRFLLRHDGTVAEVASLAGIVVGPALPEQWGAPAREADFYDVKGDVEALVSAGGTSGRFRFRPARHPALHPGQAAEVTDASGQPIGLLGSLHPSVRAHLGLEQSVFLFELRLDLLEKVQIPAFEEVSRFPSIRRDIAVVVDNRVPAQAVLDCVTQVSGKLLANLELFDEYRGEGIDSGRKSLAMGLTLQDSSRTLKEGEVEALMEQVVKVLASQLGAGLRQ